jgi:ABC-type transporter Mla subunit MlaD
MEETRRNLWVGAFVACGLVALAVLVVLFGQGPSWLGGSRFRLHAIFDDAGSIRTGNLVTVRGLRIGEVSSIDLVDPARLDQGVDVVLSLQQRYARSLHEGAVAVTSEVIFGQGRPPVELSPGPPDAPLLAAGATIRGETRRALDSLIPPEAISSFQRVTRQIGDAAEAMTPVLNELQDLFQKRTPEQVDQGFASGNISSAATRLDTVLKSMGDLVADPNIQNQIHQTVANVRDMSEKGQRFMTELESAVKDARQVLADGREMIANANRKLDNADTHIADVARGITDALDRADRVLDDLHTVSQQVASGQGNVGQLLMDNKLYESLLETTDKLRAAITQFQALVEDWQKHGMKMR